MANKEMNEEESIEKALEKAHELSRAGHLYDCKHLQFVFERNKQIEVQRLTMDHYIEPIYIPPVSFYCKKLECPCVFMYESSTDAVRGSYKAMPFSLINNPENFPLCDDRESDNEIVPEQTFLFNKLLEAKYVI